MEMLLKSYSYPAKNIWTCHLEYQDDVDDQNLIAWLLTYVTRFIDNSDCSAQPDSVKNRIELRNHWYQ